MTLEIPVLANNEDLSICAVCEGQCCKFNPGTYSPDDFGPDITRIAEAVRDPDVEIDYIEETVGSKLVDGEWEDTYRQTYYLRPRISERAGFGGVCAHLTDTGCRLPFERRPLECRDLVPVMPPAPCTFTVDHMELKRSWTPYQAVIFDTLRAMRKR